MCVNAFVCVCYSISVAIQPEEHSRMQFYSCQNVHNVTLSTPVRKCVCHIHVYESVYVCVCGGAKLCDI